MLIKQMVDRVMNKLMPWWIAIFAMLAMMVSNGLILTGLSVYDVQFIDHFDWNMSQIKLRDMITLLVTGLAAPFAGGIIDRWGVRRSMMVGWAVLSGCYYSYSQLASLSQMYWIHAVFGFVLVVCGLNACVILVSNWFVKYRGTAIGLALVGTSLGGALFPQFSTNLIAQSGWSQTLLYVGAFPVLMLALTLLFVKDAPEGSSPYLLAEVETPLASTGMDYQDALKTRDFWALAIIAMATFYTVLGTQAHVFKYMRDAGFDAQISTNAISLFFTCALIGKFIFGALSDALDQRKVFVTNLLVMLVGALTLAQMNVDYVWVAMVLFGLGWGGVYTLLQLTVMNRFGVKDAGKILGTITILDALGGGLGIFLTGVMYDRLGSYGVPFAIFCGLIVLALLALTQVRTKQSVQNA
jgi:MFS family permease